MAKSQLWWKAIRLGEDSTGLKTFLLPIAVTHSWLVFRLSGEEQIAFEQ